MEMVPSALRLYVNMSVRIAIFWFNLEKNQLKEIPILSLSGNSIEAQKYDYRNINIQGFLRKPITSKELIEATMRFLN